MGYPSASWPTEQLCACVGSVGRQLCGVTQSAACVPVQVELALEAQMGLASAIDAAWDILRVQEHATPHGRPSVKRKCAMICAELDIETGW